MQLNATRIGILTGAIMIIVYLLLQWIPEGRGAGLQWLEYIFYAAGIVWAVYAYTRSAAYEGGRFGALFSQGFRCFIVVTLMMVIFTFVYLKMYPGLKDQMALAYNSELVKQGNYTPAEISTMVEKARSYFETMMLSRAIFGYLATGALLAAVTAGFFMKRK